MNQRIHIGLPPVPVRPLGSAPAAPQANPAAAGPSFADVLSKVQDEGTLKFSAHAQQRLQQVNRTLTAQELQQVSSAVDKAAAKGARESLILMRDMALVVSVKNRTVITAVDESRMRENIFTNIDSAVIL